MVKRTSKQSLREEREKAFALAEFRRTPRIVCVIFSHDNIECIFALRVSHNEEPHTVHMCKDRGQAEFVKAWQRDVGLWSFEDAFRQHKAELTPWGWKRSALEDFTPDYFETYHPEDRGDPCLEVLPFSLRCYVGRCTKYVNRNSLDVLRNTFFHRPVGCACFGERLRVSNADNQECAGRDFRSQGDLPQTRRPPYG